jgi:hypothetical protein
MGKRRHMAYQVRVRAIVPALICITPRNVRSWHFSDVPWWTGCVSQEKLCVDSKVADMYPAV